MDKFRKIHVDWFNKCIEETVEPREVTKTKKEVAERMGMALATLHARLRGEGKDFTTTELQKAAEYFGKEPPTTRKSDQPQKNNVVALRPAPATREWVDYPVLGSVEAGAFREADMLSQVEPRSVPGGRSAIHPNATPMAWEVHGDSMNEEGILDGTVVIGVDFNEAGGVLTNDAIVVVEQDRGGLIERSVKMVAVFPDRTEFQPRSTDSRHKPIIYRNGNRDDDVSVRILTVVHGFYRSL